MRVCLRLSLCITLSLPQLFLDPLKFSSSWNKPLDFLVKEEYLVEDLGGTSYINTNATAASCTWVPLLMSSNHPLRLKEGAELHCGVHIYKKNGRPQRLFSNF
ncbi:hypothetical protein AAC387_Pa10g0147 [Persea americana]